MYEIIFSDNAFRQLKKLEKNIQDRIIAVLERARIRPEAHFQKLVGETAFRLRIGDYRVIADIDKNELKILVIKVGHRRNIYDRY
ncbi:MAG: type II toxin-antitoxin system RelE/ParE family toxin [Candidatus Diapherotrites archaeon]|nr:type II toxin-antitoxin system RelE/ParE family toxin [Candidatus Diapherotrites archaeon]